MAQENLKGIIRSLKTTLEENGGELGYWGEEIKSKVRRPTSDVQSPMKKEVFRTSDIGHRAPDTGLPKKGSEAEKLAILREKEIGDCQRCPLGKTRTKLVFGVGNPEARVMFIGEGPGFDEDRKGEPFVGKAGQLLDKIMASIGLNRSNAYIANIVKCHPMIDPKRPEMRGNDRAPNPTEAETCLPFLLEQVNVVQPKFIVTLGAVAARYLLNRPEGITKLRGQWIEASLILGKPPILVMPTYHPAALLRDATLKKLVWEDMKKLRERLKD